MASAKIHINLRLGLIEAEGDEAFVRTVYEDFKERLHTSSDHQDEPERDAAREAGNGDKSRSPARRARSSNSTSRKGNGEAKGSSAGGISRYEPKRDPDLDLGELSNFMSQFEPKGNPERYLLYAWFLKEEAKKEPCSIDDIYSCFLEMKDDIPLRMGQNLIDTRARNGFLKFSSPHDITITSVGINHFNKKIARKATE